MKRLWGFGRRFYIGEDGIILPLLLVLLALGVLMITPTLGHGFTNLQANRITENRAEELYAADSGIEEGLFWLMSGKQDNLYWTWDDVSETGSRTPLAINGASVAVSVATLPSMGDNYYRVDSVATGPDGTTTVLSQVWAYAPPLDDFDDIGQGTHDGDAYVEGDADLHGTVTGNVVVTGDLVMKDSDSEIGGDLTVEGDFTQNSQSTVNGNVCAGGNMTMNAWSSIEGDVVIELDDGEDATLELKGNALIQGDIYILAADGNSAQYKIILSNKDVVGDIYVTSNVTLTIDAHHGATYGFIHNDWNTETPPRPDCASVVDGGAAINTYEIS